MKVLLLAPPLTSPGGIQRYTVCLIRALQSLIGTENVRSVAIGASATGQSHQRFSVGMKLRFGAKAAAETLGWRPDLIICAHLAFGPLGRRLANLIGRPYWVLVYGIEAWALLPVRKRDALRQANRVVGISEFSQEQVVRQHQIDPRRMVSLPCMLDDTLLKIEPAYARVSTMIPNGKRVVLTVARMASSERYKGHDLMFQALSSVVAKVPDVTYVVVGDGDDRERLEGLVQSLGIMENVLFTGEVDDSALSALYRRSEVFALPARTVIDDHYPKGEGFGIVYLEALAFGKPVIGPNCGAPAEIIRHGEHGLLVDPEDPSAIADAMLCLLSNPDKAKAMGASGVKWVEERSSFDSFRERLKGILAASTSQGHRA